MFVAIFARIPNHLFGHNKNFHSIDMENYFVKILYVLSYLPLFFCGIIFIMKFAPLYDFYDMDIQWFLDLK